MDQHIQQRCFCLFVFVFHALVCLQVSPVTQAKMCKNNCLILVLINPKAIVLIPKQYFLLHLLFFFSFLFFIVLSDIIFLPFPSLSLRMPSAQNHSLHLPRDFVCHVQDDLFLFVSTLKIMFCPRNYITRRGLNPLLIFF